MELGLSFYVSGIGMGYGWVGVPYGWVVEMERAPVLSYDGPPRDPISSSRDSPARYSWGQHLKLTVSPLDIQS